jgi:hypothetical protein
MLYFEQNFNTYTELSSLHISPNADTEFMVNLGESQGLNNPGISGSSSNSVQGSISGSNNNDASTKVPNLDEIRLKIN